MIEILAPFNYICPACYDRSELSTWVLYRLEREWMETVSQYFLEVPIFTVHFIAEYLEHAIVNLLQPAKCEHANCSENES